MQNRPTVLIAGCGDVGTRLGVRLAADGWRVLGLRRDCSALPPSIEPVSGDLAESTCPPDWPVEAPDYLVYAAAANSHDEAGYRQIYVEGLANVLDWLRVRGQRPRRLLFVSSSGVYGQSQGEWVDEESPTEPSSFSGRVLLEAEQLALSSGLSASVVRLAGIYGPGRRWLIGQVRQGHRVPAEPPQYGNRIHAEDAAGLLAHLVEEDRRGTALQSCYLGVDDEPAALYEVVEWLRERLNVTQETPAPVSRRAGSKRCSNARARALGWQPAYPSFREGYASLLAEA